MRMLLMLLCLILLTTKEAHAMEAKALFAGGCFWCVEAVFDQTNGVVSTTSGYAGGDAATADYKTVSTGATDHLEALQVTYDPKKVSYDQLLQTFWENIDPLDAGGQFADRGKQYTTAIFALNDDQREAAKASKKTLSEKLGKPVVTAILPPAEFYAAEEYHQDYHRKNPVHYERYKYGSGRPARLKELKEDMNK